MNEPNKRLAIENNQKSVSVAYGDYDPDHWVKIATKETGAETRYWAKLDLYFLVDNTHRKHKNRIKLMLVQNGKENIYFYGGCFLTVAGVSTDTILPTDDFIENLEVLLEVSQREIKDIFSHGGCMLTKDNQYQIKEILKIIDKLRQFKNYKGLTRQGMIKAKKFKGKPLPRPMLRCAVA